MEYIYNSIGQTMISSYRHKTAQEECDS